MAGLSGLISGFYGSDEEIYGKKIEGRDVPAAPDYIASLKKTVKGNIDLVPSLTELATKSTRLYSDLMEASSPGTKARNAKVGSIIDEMLSGKVPKDVQWQLEQFGAARASRSGAGTDIGNAWTFNDFRETSYARQQQGVTAAMRWQEQSRAGIFDFSKLFRGVDESEREADAEWNRDWLAVQADHAPDPKKRGAYDSEMALIGMVLSAYGGGAGYTGQYRSGGSGGGGGSGPGDSNADYMGGRSSFFNQQERDVNTMRPMGSW